MRARFGKRSAADGRRTGEGAPGLGFGRRSRSPERGPAPVLPPGVRRSRYLLGLTGLLIGVLVAGIAASWLLYRSVRDEMDRQLGKRLLSIATTAGQAIGSNRFEDLIKDGDTSPEYGRLREELQATALVNDLDNITLVDVERRTLMDLRVTVPGPSPRHAGETVRDRPGPWEAPDPLLGLQPDLLMTLLSGEPRVTGLVEVHGLPGEYLKTGYAAVEDSTGRILGAISVEGGSDFFSVLPGMRQRLRWGAGLGLSALFILTLLMLRVLRSFMRYEDSLRRAAALAAIGQISAVVAHEIKNPLAIIRSRSERVRAKIEAGRDPKEILEWFEAIPAEVDRLDSILTSYLSMARPDSEGEGACRPEEVAEETLRLLAPELEKRGIRLETEYENPRRMSAAMGARSLRQVLLNLMLNAAQAMEEGGRLAVRVRGERQAIELTVEDTGHGMSEENRKKVLEPFFTTRPTGSGLGLTLVQSLVQARGGELEIRSAPGQGTRVTIRLPQARGRLRDDQSRETSDQKDRSPAGHGSGG